MSVRNEFEFIESITPITLKQPSTKVGIGDDAAIIAPHQTEETVICVDTMVEAVHFAEKTMTPHAIGYKALAANISDLAAMGARPAHYLVSIAIPKHWSTEQLADIYEGLADAALPWEMDLIGGDTVSTSGPLTISVTVTGMIPVGKRLLRSNAQEGDIVFVTGTIGDSSYGLHHLLADQREIEPFFIERHQYPTPRVAVGQQLLHYDRVALNDISDGLASEANELASASKVNIVIDEHCLPIMTEIRAQENYECFSLFGGEDYELVGTMSVANWHQFEQVAAANDWRVTAIGTVQKGEGHVFLRRERDTILLEKKGFNHFK